MRRLLAGAILLVVTCLAQTPAPSQNLTLEQAVAIAIQNHPRIAAAQNVEAAAGQRVTEARSAYYPAINAEITASQAYYGSRLGAGELATSLLFSKQGDGLAVDQLVTDFGRTGSLVANARLQAEAAVQSTLATRYDVVIGVNRAYFGVLQAQALVRVAQETVTARQTVADQVTALGKAQLKSQEDVSFAQVNLSEAQLMLIRARAGLQQAFVDLARTMGQDIPPAQYQLTEGVAPGAPPPSVEDLVGQAVLNRPELSDLRLRYQAAQKFENAERDLKRPNVNLVAVGGRCPIWTRIRG